MSFQADDRGKIGQSSYWLHFGGYVLGAVLLIGLGAYQLVEHHYAAGILTILVVVPLGIYFRVIMMRRCRDIGWPVILPWLLTIMSAFIGGFWGFLGAVSHNASMTAPFTFGALSSFLDFVLVIVLGCMPSKTDYNFDSYNFDPRGLPQAPLPRDDEALFHAPPRMARPIASAAPIQPRPTPRQPGVFGRRGL